MTDPGPWGPPPPPGFDRYAVLLGTLISLPVCWLLALAVNRLLGR